MPDENNDVVDGEPEKIIYTAANRPRVGKDFKDPSKRSLKGKSGSSSTLPHHILYKTGFRNVIAHVLKGRGWTQTDR